jgi:F-type H+-transporting ATPase subunit a
MAGLVPEAVEYNFGGFPVSLAMTGLVWGLLGLVSFFVVRKRGLIPGRAQSLFEICFESIYALSVDMFGDQARKYFPLFICLFIFIVVSNLLGLVPGFSSPTSDLSLTGALALIVFVYYNYQGFRARGAGYLKHFLGPALPWYLFPVRVVIALLDFIAFFVRPFSLALRLFCNILSKELLLAILGVLLVKFFFSPDYLERLMAAAPFLLRPAIILLGVLVGLIQGFVFMALSMSYMAGAIQMEHV